MDEHQTAPKAPSLRVVVRLLVLAAAAVAGWLLISGGPAQADDTGSARTAPLGQVGDSSGAQGPKGAAAQAAPQAGSPGKPVPEVPADLVQNTAAVVTDPVRAVPQEASQAVDQVTAPAPPAVRPAVQTLTVAVEPTLTATTARVADTIDRTASAADAVADPTLQTAGLQAEPRNAPPASTGATAVLSPPERGRAHDRSAPGAETSIDPATIALADDHFTGHGDRTGDTEPGSVPALPDSPAAPGGPSTVTVGAAAGLLAGLLMFAPVFLRRLGLVDSEPLPSGPAYPPGSSPD